MKNDEYMNMLYIFRETCDTEKKLIVEWENGLKVSCISFTGIYETDTEPEDKNYIGEYAAAIGDIEILHTGNDNSVEIFENFIEISLKCIPVQVSSENGTILWKKQTI